MRAGEEVDVRVRAEVAAVRNDAARHALATEGDGDPFDRHAFKVHAGRCKLRGRHTMEAGLFDPELAGVRRGRAACQRLELGDGIRGVVQRKRSAELSMPKFAPTSNRAVYGARRCSNDRPGRTCRSQAPSQVAWRSCSLPAVLLRWLAIIDAARPRAQSGHRHRVLPR
ncbi:MAG: hypothetical protein IPP28_02435 [Xanthomonadales bacterium]|nr:hypothetical protein [Xanthomonadales bacterium]